MTPNGSPVVYKMYKCDARYKRGYFDLNGRQWKKSLLVPSSRHQLNEALEGISGRDLDINEKLDSLIEEIAKKRGIL
tara:strand:- start:216 stop:446 length:231 start_codon:yes stop_codon:yes gene_type:complete